MDKLQRENLGNSKEVLQMSVMAKPIHTTLTISKEKSKEFINKKTSKDKWLEIQNMSTEFQKNNLKR